MTRSLTAVSAAALAVVLALPASQADAQYYYRRGPSGGAVAAGVLGGLAAGAIIGGAIASSRPGYAAPAPAYGPPPPPPPPYAGYAPVAGYAPYPAYAGPMPVACPGGYWARRPLYDDYGQFVRYSRPRWFCP
ncbi:hypothetical protein [Rhodoplanes sp. SY1]|uniref:hypothetical protein n=1 Tax=Rhodoplanes sp. SY1 TaxID=3166646 RepID=UPI0038B5A301